MKIIRLKHNDVPKESMSFRYFKYKAIEKQAWEESDFCNQLEMKFFFVVYKMNEDESQVIFQNAFLIGIWATISEFVEDLICFCEYKSILIVIFKLV